MSVLASAGAAFLAGGLLALSLAAYLFFALPRLSSTVAWMVTGTLSLVLLAGGVYGLWAASGSSAWVAVLLPSNKSPSQSGPCRSPS